MEQVFKELRSDENDPLFDKTNMLKKEFPSDFRQIRYFTLLIVQSAPTEIKELNLLGTNQKIPTLKKEEKRDFVTNQEGSNVNRPTVKKKIGRNDPCPCGSGKKYKDCCANK